MLTVEDGSGLSDSDSYASEVEFVAYAAARGVTVTNDITDEQLLIKAMDYIESFNFIGDKYISTQALQWPRINIVVDGFYLDREVIPQLLKDAQMEAALSIDGGTNPLANEARATKREKVDVIEVEYMDSASNKVILTAVETKISKLIKQHTGSFRV